MIQKEMCLQCRQLFAPAAGNVYYLIRFRHGTVSLKNNKRTLTSQRNSLSIYSLKKLPLISNKNSDSNPRLSSHSMNPIKLTSLVFSKIPVSVQYIIEELPSCPKTSNSPEELEVKDSKE
jgi:hypothetical protein